ncbi:hypothetical protein [Candidatus Venteria ishoeyi]|uniref:Uncharacterized protein n=1 Tax=Candidatus Venteria ishoeyi TaxID=1899563 RepID=A0A1H6F6Q4_9GAMM|nr:hypothetical protein [Candidatus Venteria ishoeyi]MDM8545811.1 hypothetical protein [Candidatus Venteria ishoeyi]SEH04969.1 Uncharacterised protein [Candidatus Venteria ishoeyi]
MSTATSFQDLVRRNIIEYAFFRWESAVILGLTAGGTLLSVYLNAQGIVPSWLWGGSLGFGLLSESLLFYSSITDTDNSRMIIDRLLREQYYPKDLKNQQLQAQIDKAFAYHSRLESRVNRWRDTSLKDHLNETAEQVREWLKTSYTLAQRIDRYLSEYELLQADRVHASQRLKVLERQFQQEKDPGLRKQLEITQGGLQRQVAALDNVDNTMKQAKLQLEHTISAVGTIYSQTLLIEARELDGSRLGRVREEVAGEITQLNDILSAMSDVYQDV